ncbi:MAG: hypothetical protein JWM87_2067 [Candidatus Eremiobacteraeota bacterium]|nr:hypothetical protein [Candidatus Eremiobacteraeota bacterium]
MRYASLLLTAFLLGAAEPAPGDVPPVLFDTYYIGVRCAGVDAHIASAPAAGMTVVASAVSRMLPTESIFDRAAADKRLRTTCDAAMKRSLSFDEFEEALRSIEATIPHSSDGPSLRKYLNIDWLPRSTTTEPDVKASQMAAAYEYFREAAPGTAVSITPGYRYYVTLLVVDSATPDDPDTAKLYTAFRNFGKTIGAARAAVWLGRYDKHEVPDIDHARYLSEHFRTIGRYRYDWTAGPYLVFTDRPPNLATSTLPLDLHDASTAERIQWIDYLAQQLDASMPDDVRVAPADVLMHDLTLNVNRWLRKLKNVKLGA